MIRVKNRPVQLERMICERNEPDWNSEPKAQNNPNPINKKRKILKWLISNIEILYMYTYMYSNNPLILLTKRIQPRKK